MHDVIKKYQNGERNFARADLSNANLSHADLSNANLSDAYLSNANLKGADLSDAYLSNANLKGADLSGANLKGAYLKGADLSHADLSGANLSDANLRGANLGTQWIIQSSTRSDGYQFLLTNFTDEGIRIKAGCRNFTIEAAKTHWENTRGGTPLGDETFLIISQLLELAKIRGLMK